MDQEDEAAERPNALARLEKHSDTPAGVSFRVIIASIPVIGNGASVLLESQLAKRQAQRIDRLVERVAALEAERTEASETTPPSDNLLELAAMAAAATPELDRVTSFANLLYLDGAGEDHAEVLRRFLIEVLATLSRYEVALLVKHSAINQNDPGSQFAEKLLTLHARNPEVDDVRRFALDRLETFRLITIEQEHVEITRVGRYLLSAL